MSEFKLRKYQSEACNAVIKEFDRGVKRTLIVLPTGCGKTIVFCGVAFKFAFNPDHTPKGKRVLVLAHSIMLIDQATEKFQKALNLPVTRVKTGKEPEVSPIYASTIQTMRNRLWAYDSNFFDLIIIDEAHHSQATSYQSILDHFGDAYVLGVTATPDRSDRQILKNFQSEAYRYNIDDAIQDGFLTPLNIVKSDVSIDLTDVQASHGDLESKSLGKAVDNALHDIAKELHDKAMGRKIICFCPYIQTAKLAAKTFNKYGFRATWTSGVDQMQKVKLDNFREGNYDILCNAMLLTEGYDCPSVDCVVILRPTTSRSLYTQMLGRGLRLSPETCKTDCLFIDFLFQNSQFDLVAPKDIIGGKDDLPQEPDEPEEPDSEKEEEKEPGEERDVMKSLTTKLAEATMRKASLKNAWDDPELAQIMIQAHQEMCESDLWDGPVTGKQAARIEAHGYLPYDISFSQARALIGWFYDHDQPTKKQIWFLRYHGIPEDQLAILSKSKAGKLIGEIKAKEGEQRLW